MTDDDEMLAAEYALGLLSVEEAAAVETRFSRDAALSLRVAWWRDQFSSLAADAPFEPGSHVWPAILARLGTNDNEGDDRRTRRWQWATGAMTAVAATLLAVIALRPVPAPVTPTSAVTAAQIAPTMVASLSGEGAAAAIAFDGINRRIRVTPLALDAGTGDTELWVIPVGATAPVSLGLIDARVVRSSEVDDARSRLLVPGATFAISREAKGGSTTGAPQGPVIATGKIIRV